MRPSRSMPISAIATIAALVAGACGEDDSADPGRAAVELRLDSTTLTIDGPGRWEFNYATPYDASGRPIETLDIDWRSLNPAVATVAAGRITGVSAGETSIVAAYGRVSDTLRVIVRAPALVRVVAVDAYAAGPDEQPYFYTALENTRASGVFIVDFWGRPAGETSPLVLMSSGPPTEVESGYTATLAWRPWTGGGLVERVVVRSRSLTSTLFADSTVFDVSPPR